MSAPDFNKAAPELVEPMHPNNESDIGIFRVMADAMPGLVWIADADGRVLFFNRRWWDYTGMTPEQFGRDEWHRFLFADDIENSVARWQLSVSTGEPYEVEYRIRNAADGEYRWHLGRGLPARDIDGTIVRWFGTCTDIHDRKTAEQLLQKAKEQLEAVGKAKDEFLSIVTHELRTPLSAILGWTQLLEMDVLDDTERREAIETIKQQAKSQSQLIEDLLDVSRILNGKFHLRSQQVQLSAVVQAAFTAARPIADQSGVTLTHCDFDGRLLATGDPQRLQQVITNLLANAIKFTPQGGNIDLSLTLQNGQACVTVRDSGMGIPVDDIEAIFERFKQVGSAAIRDKGGLGLGLSIVRHIVDAHGGTVHAKSDGPGRGSAFEMRLPLVNTPAETAVSSADDGGAAVESLAGISVLVVDDEDSARTVIATALQKAGASVVAARDAADAWSKLSAGTFAVLVSDVAMPGEDGLDLIAKVRGATAVFRNVPAVALTGFASVDDQTRALAAGFQMHVAKPVEPRELIRRVAALSRR